jgi:3-dehydroquinate synthase
MTKLTFTTPTAVSKIIIGDGLLEQFVSLVDISNYTSIFVITDTNVGSIYLPKLLEHLPDTTQSTTIPSGEEHKNINTLNHIWNTMLEAGLDRKSLIINLGGGVVTDIGAFAASTFMRGLDFVNIPTTLLSQVDASVGGKTGIDFGGVKNSIGSFTLARYVLVDINTLNTLPQREKLSGMGEIIKHGFLSKTIKEDSDYLQQVIHHIKTPKPETLESIILNSIKLKIQVCEQDPQEKLGIRKVLNLGHTLGHAIESFSIENDEVVNLFHGECVAIGISLESQLAVSIGILSSEELNRIQQILLDAQLPISCPLNSPKDIERIMQLLKSDKKNTGGIVKFVLPTSTQTAQWDCEVDEQTIEKLLSQQLK